MAFLGKVFNKKNQAVDVDEQDESQEWSFDFDLDGDKEEKQDISRFTVNSVKAGEEPDTDDEDTDEETSEDDEEETDEASQDDEEDEEKEASPADSLMNIFEEEVAVNRVVEVLASSVEEVDAEELAEDLRALVDDLQGY